MRDNYRPPEPIPLTPSEKALAELVFLKSEWPQPDPFHPEAQKQLAESVRDRIPPIRLRYFQDPALCTRRGNGSHCDDFKMHGLTEKEIVKHPGFTDFLRYFIYGPDLPARTIQGFCKILNDDLGSSGMVGRQLRKFVRAEVRGCRFDRVIGADAAEEFFKLGIELGVDALSGFSAYSMRGAALSALSELRRSGR